MSALSMFIPITKIDAAKRLVYGLATAEKKDRSGEICDYETTKPFYEKWSGEISKATDGKSLGNVRAMHGNVAAGKLTSIICNDDEKQIEICAKVVDDAEWLKVEEGVYTGFSQGGAYVKRWKDADGLQRYTADPIEVSLVDVPCLPDSTFQMVKADGTTELRKFATVVAAPSITAIGNRADQLAKGNTEGKTYRDFMETANQQLLEEAVAAAEKLAKGTTVEEPAAGPVEEQPAPETPAATVEPAEAAKPARKWVEPKQLWVCDHADHEHLTKAEAVRCMKDDDAAAVAKAAASPVDATLARLEAALGVTVPAPETEKAANTDKSDGGTAMPDGSFPIKNKADLKNAVQAFGRAKNKTAARRHIIRRAKALGATDLLPADWPGSTKDADKSGETVDLEKAVSLYGVANLISLLACLDDAEESFEMDSYWGGSVNATDDLKNRFGAMLVEFGDIVAEALDTVLAGMEDEESSEEMTRLAPLAALIKAGARHSKTDLNRLQKLHDLAVELGAGCPNDEEPAGKAADGDDLSKALSENAALKGQLSSLETRLAAVVAKVEQMGERPAAAKAALLAVGKGEDSGQVAGQAEQVAEYEKRLAGMTEQERNRELMKLALKFPKLGHPDQRQTDTA